MDKRTVFTAAELQILRESFATVERVSPSRLSAFHSLFDRCTDAGLKQLAQANIKFVSKLARNACMRRNGALMAMAEHQIERLMSAGEMS